MDYRLVGLDLSGTVVYISQMELRFLYLRNCWNEGTYVVPWDDGSGFRRDILK